MQAVTHRLFSFARKHRLRDQKGLWLTTFLRSIAYSLIGGFSAIYIFTLGRESFWSQDVRSGILLLVLFQITIRGLTFLLSIPVSSLVTSRIGYRRTIILSTVFSSLAFGLMAFSAETKAIWPIFVAAMAFSVVVSTYWIVYRSMFTENASEDSMGSSFGVLEAVTKLGQVISPLFAAFLIVSFGYQYLFGFGVVFLILSGLPMVFLGSHEHHDEVSWGEFFSWMREWVFVRFSISAGGRLINDIVYMDFWPVYLILMLGSIESIGWLRSAVILASAVFTYVISKVFDKTKNNNGQVIGVSGGVLMWIFRGFSSGLAQVVLIDSLDKFFNSITQLFYFAHTFKRAKGQENFSFIVYFEMVESLGATILLAVLGLLVFLLPMSAFWFVVFGLAAFGQILTLLVQEHHKG